MTDIRTKFARLGMNLTPDDVRIIGMNQPDYTISFGMLSQIIDSNPDLCHKIFYDFLQRYTLSQDEEFLHIEAPDREGLSPDKTSQVEVIRNAIKNSKGWFNLPIYDTTTIFNFFDCLKDFIEESAEIFDIDPMIERVRELFEKPLLKAEDIKKNQQLLFKVFAKFRSTYNSTISASHGVVMNYHIEQIIVNTCKAFSSEPKEKQRTIEGFCELLIGTVLKQGNSEIALKKVEIAFKNDKIHKLWGDMKVS